MVKESPSLRAEEATGNGKDRATRGPGRRLHGAIAKVANPRGEFMLGLVNDVMMCTNRKTCWWKCLLRS